MVFESLRSCSVKPRRLAEDVSSRVLFDAAMAGLLVPRGKYGARRDEPREPLLNDRSLLVLMTNRPIEPRSRSTCSNLPMASHEIMHPRVGAT